MEKALYQEHRLKDGRMLVIRSAGAEDYKAYSRLLHRCGAETNNLSFGAEDCPYTEEYCRSYLQSLEEKPASLCLLAFVEDALVGEISLNQQPRRCAHTAELGICIIQDCCGMGIGRLLMDAAMDAARRDGQLHSLCLTVDADNEAGLRLYSRCGFQEYGRYRASVYIDGAYHDMVLMNYYF